MRIANTITCVRILCGVTLIFCTPFSQWFYFLYVIGGISDVIDGFVARRLKTESKLGAKLDTIADLIFAVVVLLKIINAVNVPMWLIIWIICIAIIKFINIVSGIIRSGNFPSEHTVLNKMCGALLFAIPFCIGRLPWQVVALLVIIACALATAAAIQEGYFIRKGKGID